MRVHFFFFLHVSVMKVGDVVSVFSDVEGRCTRGAKDFQGKKICLGNGVCVMNRCDIFCAEGPVR